MLTESEKQRYSRHIVLPEIGIKGQEKLKKAKVLVVGAGGLGSPALFYLAAAGVGTIGIVEYDSVEISNLQRQILYRTADIGKNKADIAADRLRELNPHITIEVYDKKLNSNNAETIISNYDLVVDCPDNYGTRLLVSDVTKVTGIPHIYGSVSRFEGQLSVFNFKGGSTYRDLFSGLESEHTD
ncbi:MAG: HesA/MoeB/ThiF family protein, partial [Bacteroidota bacterium]